MKLRASSTEILDLCHRHGIAVQLVSGRFRFQHCPFCNASKHKIWVYERDAAGSCFKCRQTFNLLHLLEAFGVPTAETAQLRGYRPSVQNGEPTLPEDLQEGEDEPPEAKANLFNGALESWRFFRIDDRPNHPASKYARSRGVPPDLYDRILIDVATNSVCFLVLEGESLVGFQNRYVDPDGENKTYTSAGFRTSQHILTYEQPASDRIFVCEGPFNAVTAFLWGHTGVCTFGSRLSAQQIFLIRDLAVRTNRQICCAFDMDDAGLHAYLQMKDVCEGYGVEVLKVEPETGNDLNDSWKAGKSYIVNDSTDSYTSLLNYLPELKP